MIPILSYVLSTKVTFMLDWTSFFEVYLRFFIYLKDLETK